MKVLVTGGAGFIGSHVVDALVADGHEVVVADVLLPKAHACRPAYLNGDATFVRVDVRDSTALEGLVDGCDAVSHQAAMVGLGQDFSDVTDYVSHNDLGTAAMLGALHATGFAGRLVVASSMVVYGEGAYICDAHGVQRPAPRSRGDLDAGRWDPLCPACGRTLTVLPTTEEQAVDPRNVYAATKLHQEHLALLFGRETGVSVAALRYHNVYGPRMPRDTPYAGVASIFRSSLESGCPPKVFEDGRQLRDFVHVEDVARANVVALSNKDARGCYNIASGEPHTIGEMAGVLTRAFDSVLPPEVTGDYRLGDVRHVIGSPDKARRELGWLPEIDFEEGMRTFARQPLRARSPQPRTLVRGTSHDTGCGIIAGMSTWAGNLIRLTREETGLSQRALAGRAKTSQAAIAAYEAGRRSPTLETLARIVRAAGLDLRIRLEPQDDHDEWLARYEAGLPPDLVKELRRQDRNLLDEARHDRRPSPARASGAQ